MDQPITEFHGPHRFLSNFWPCLTTYEGVEYQTSEHAYQAAKFMNPVHRKMVAGQKTPSMAKNFAKHNLGSYRRPDWDDVKLKVMRDILLSKFSRSHMKAALIATGDAQLIEGNTWGDTFWGVCDGVGENHLGRLLMELRSMAKQGIV